jgi:hypothetical protein
MQCAGYVPERETSDDEGDCLFQKWRERPLLLPHKSFRRQLSLSSLYDVAAAIVPRSLAAPSELFDATMIHGGH